MGGNGDGPYRTLGDLQNRRRRRAKRPLAGNGGRPQADNTGPVIKTAIGKRMSDTSAATEFHNRVP